MRFRDLKAQYIALKNEINAQIERVIDSSEFILGRQVAELEEKLAYYVGRKYCVSCANGTDALMLALMTMNAGPGDAVFVPDYTFIASADAAVILGAVPVFTDIVPQTFNMCPESLEKQIQRILKKGKHTPKAIVTVDLFGQPADYDRIIPIAEKYDLKIIEDAAQGFGGSIRGKRACSFGDISITSFFPAKPLGCYGDGGAVFTDDEQTACRLRSIRAHGRIEEDKYYNQEVGINSRLDTLQAAILLAKLKAFEEYETENVNKIAERYTQLLGDRFTTPSVLPGFKSSWAQYTILCRDGAERKELQKRLREHDIPTRIYFPRGLHQQKVFEGKEYSDLDYVNSIDASSRALSLPINPYLSDEEVNMICKTALGE